MCLIFPLQTQILQLDVPHRLRTVLTTSLEKGLFVGLLQERKTSLCEVILDIGVQDHEMVVFPSSILSSALIVLLVCPVQEIAREAPY
jgi:hypothetical protein